MEKEGVINMILGIDLSSANTGWAILDEDNLIKFGSIIPPDDTLANKILHIHNELKAIFDENDITNVALEDQFLGPNVNTLKVLSRICGSIMLTAIQYEKEITFFPPKTIKMHFSGTGKATKKIMMDRAKELYGIKKLNDNEADAIAIAYTYHKLRGANK